MELTEQLFGEYNSDSRLARSDRVGREGGAIGLLRTDLQSALSTIPS